MKLSLMAAAWLLGASSAVHALEYKTLAEHAIVYDAGSRQATPQFILLRGTPVEVIVTVEKWVKVREQSGGLGWIERSQIGDGRNLIVVAGTEVRQQPESASPVVFSVAKDVLLEYQERPTGAWVKVKHRDGQAGYVPLRAIWGI